MNKNCIILEIHPEDVYPIISDYDGPCSLYTAEEAAAEVDRLTAQRRKATSWEIENGIPVPPGPRYQVVVVAEYHRGPERTPRLTGAADVIP